MSFWISYASDVLLEQQSFDYSKEQTSPLASLQNKYTITSPPLNTTRSIPRWFQTVPTIIKMPHKYSPPQNRSISTASPKEKVLYFGSSCASQYPKKAQTQTASPWNLFTHKSSSSPISICNVFHQLRSLEHFLNKECLRHSSYQNQTANKDTEQSRHFQPPIKTAACVPQQYASIHKKAEKPSTFASYIWEKPEHSNSKQCLLVKNQASTQDQEQQQQQQQQQHDPNHSFQKYKNQIASDAAIPVLIPPTLGIFALSYLLTKQGILADFAAYSIFKENLEQSQKELKTCHEERIQIIKQSIEKQSQKKVWQTFARILEWATSWLNLAIATTAVFFSGGLLAIGALVAAILVLIINIIDELDGWRTIVKHLPGKHQEQKLKLLSIVKFALLIISGVISIRTVYYDKLPGSTIIQGVFKALPPALEGGIALLRGTMVGLQSRLLKTKEHFLQIESKIDVHNWERNDMLSHTEELLENLEGNFEQIIRILELNYDTTRSTIHCFR